MKEILDEDSGEDVPKNIDDDCDTDSFVYMPILVRKGCVVTQLMMREHQISYFQ